MPLRDIGEETAEDGREETGKGIDDTTFLAYFHDAEPEGEDTCEAKGNLERCLRRRERAVHHRGEDVHIAKEQQLHGGYDEGYEEECYEDIVKDHRLKGMGDEWLRVRRERLAAGWMAAIMTAQEPAGGYT